MQFSVCVTLNTKPAAGFDNISLKLLSLACISAAESVGVFSTTFR